MSNPPLGEDDVEGFVDRDGSIGTTAQLAERPFGGLVVLCPYVPDTNLRSHADLADYARYVADVLVPRARRELPVFASPEATGIDGVSLGGAIALADRVRADGYVRRGGGAAAGGRGRPDAGVGRAGAGGAGEAARSAAPPDDEPRGRLPRRDHPSLERAPRRRRRPRLRRHPRPHDYPFNRGPGAIELLLWHDRVLSRG